jgi:hypothetical protein
MTRPEWVNLNGWWEYAIVPKEQTTVQHYDGKILVPFAIESELSGVKRQLLPDQRLWYRRTFRGHLQSHAEHFDRHAEWSEESPFAQSKLREASPHNEETLRSAQGDKSYQGDRSYWDRPKGVRALLNFEAVDYQCEVWVNGQHFGAHRGGYLPFTLDITNALRDGENELVVAVWDPTDAGKQEHGKQVLKPNIIWYTAVSGIWQTVWLEIVPQTSIAALKLIPDLDAGTLTVTASLRGNGAGVSLEAVASSGGVECASGRAPATGPILLPLSQVKPWSPTDPHLYDLCVRLVRDGQVLDEVGSYFAMRKFGLVRDAHGHLRFALNGKPLFLYGPLDQGYFPDGLYTPPSEEAMCSDIEYAKKIGCNSIRKHVKVEPRRWYTACDRLGMIVWQDMPNGGEPVNLAENLLALLAGLNYRDDHWMGRFGRGKQANRQEFRDGLKELVEHLHNFPCIAIWVPFNEGWGQFQAREIAAWLKQLDPTRLVDHASGWFDQRGGDFQSLHIYMKKLYRPKLEARRAFVISEFGGYGLRLPGHLWNEEKKFSQKFFDSPQALTEAYVQTMEEELQPLIPQGLAAAIYTQTTDVEIEINGYLTYDREVEKMDAERISEAHAALLKEGATCPVENFPAATS